MTDSDDQQSASGGKPDDEAKAAKARAAEEARARKAAEEAAKPAWERDPSAPEIEDASADPLAKAIAEAHPGSLVAASRRGDELILEFGGEALAEVAKTLREQHSFDLLVDVCGVDFPEREGARFEIVYHLGNVEHARYIRLKVRVAEGAELPTVSSVWRGANWCEREIFDMYGVRFTDHPDLTRILLWDGFNGYPLRKDFPVEGLDTGAAIYPERYEPGAGPVEGTGTGWKNPKADDAES